MSCHLSWELGVELFCSSHLVLQKIHFFEDLLWWRWITVPEVHLEIISGTAISVVEFQDSFHFITRSLIALTGSPFLSCIISLTVPRVIVTLLRKWNSFLMSPYCAAISIFKTIFVPRTNVFSMHPIGRSSYSGQLDNLPFFLYPARAFPTTVKVGDFGIYLCWDHLSLFISYVSR